MSKAVIGIAKNEAQADTIVTRLQNAGVPTSDISVLMPDRTTSRDFALEHSTKAPEGTVIGAGTGSLAGGILGLLAGIGALAIPGVGPLIAADPIMAALSGAAVGGAIGGIAGALIGMGIPEFEAKQYEAKVKHGNILISVHTHDSDDAKHIQEIMQTAQAEDVFITGEASVKKSDVASETNYRAH